MTPLTPEQFDRHLVILADRHGLGFINRAFNPNVDYQVVNISRMTRDWERFNIDNNPMFDDLIKLGCRTILWDGSDNWTHPYLAEPEQMEVNEVAFASLAHMSKKLPELRYLHRNTFDDSPYGYTPPIEIKPDETFESLVAKLAKKDNWLRFQEAYNIAEAVLSLRISSFKYYRID